MWAVIGRYALQFGMWCVKNPNEVATAAQIAKDVIDELHAAKSK